MQDNLLRKADFEDRPAHAVVEAVVELQAVMEGARKISDEIRTSMASVDQVLIAGAHEAVEKLFTEQLKRFDHDRRPYGAIQRLRAAGEVVIEDVKNAIDSSAARAAGRLASELQLPIEMAITKAIQEQVGKQALSVFEKAAEEAIERAFEKMLPKFEAALKARIDELGENRES